MLEILSTLNPNSSDRIDLFTLFRIPTESIEANGPVLLYMTNWINNGQHSWHGLNLAYV